MPEQNIKVTVDAVIFRPSKKDNLTEVLLIQRKNPPFQGQWGFPGGFLEPDEDLETGAKRELEEETGLRNISLEQAGAFGKPGRDPRGPTVTIVHTGWCREDCEVTAASDAGKARWFDLSELPSLAFDHAEILNAILVRKK